MAVNWQVVDNPDLIALHESDEFEWAKTEALLVLGFMYGLMYFVGFREITEENKGEFYARLSALQGLTTEGGMAIVRKNGERVPLVYTREDIYKRVGLTTNYPNMTQKQWLKDRLLVFLNDTAKQE